MNEIKNQQLIEGFSSMQALILVRKAYQSFAVINKPLNDCLKLLKAIEKNLKKGKPNFKKDQPQKVIDGRSRMFINLSLTKLVILKRVVLPACIRTIFYSKQIKKLGPKIIERELKKGNKKAGRNFVLAAKLRFNTVKKALRDKKFAKIRAKKIPRRKPKKEKTKRIKKEKFTLNHSQMRRSQEGLQLGKGEKVEYDLEPLKIVFIIGIMFVIFNYVYFKL